MKLAFLSNKISNPVSGGQIYNEALLEAAEFSGFEVLRWEGVQFGNLNKTFIFMNVIYLFKTVFAPIKTVFVYDTDYHARYLFSLIWARYIRKAKCVGMLHHYNYLGRKDSLIRSVQKHIESLTSRQFTHLVANTPYSLECFIQLTARKIPTFLLEPMVNTDNNSSFTIKNEPSSPINILYVGSIEYRKNADQLIRACSMLSFPYTLHIVGKIIDIKYQDNLKVLLSECGNLENVNFCGSVSSQELISYYSSADIFALVSRMEGYGMVYAEAMRFGLPIVASNTGAVPDLVIDGVNGILCDPENPVHITAAIESICRPENYSQFSERNISRAKTLVTRERFIENAKKIFQKISTERIEL